MMLAAPHKLWLIDGIKHKQELISFRCLRSTTEISIEWDKYATVQERAMVFAEARWVMRGRYVFLQYGKGGLSTFLMYS